MAAGHRLGMRRLEISNEELGIETRRGLMWNALGPVFVELNHFLGHSMGINDNL